LNLHNWVAALARLWKKSNHQYYIFWLRLQLPEYFPLNHWWKQRKKNCPIFVLKSYLYKQVEIKLFLIISDFFPKSFGKSKIEIKLTLECGYKHPNKEITISIFLNVSTQHASIIPNAINQWLKHSEMFWFSFSNIN
jgi:hypothetical protein